jgi:antitoxin (DNA-binding transcriptional repressor) of toxin-antitoxin stability system
MTERRVGIAELKSRLSAYLRLVRQGGSLTVMDRDTAVARVVPIKASGSLVVRAPHREAGRPGDYPVRSRPLTSVDPVSLLLEDRGNR